jgi:hypothetical protein
MEPKAMCKRRRVDEHAFTSTMDGSHPRGIQPLGNIYLTTDERVPAEREHALGGLSVLPDDLLLEVGSCLPSLAAASLSLPSTFLTIADILLPPGRGFDARKSNKPGLLRVCLPR